MELLAETEARGRGRWIIVPRKGARFIGSRARAEARARQRRRRVLVFLLESICLTFLIGLVPPLRAIWIGTGTLTALLALYVWLLVWLAQQSPHARVRERAQAAAIPRQRRFAQGGVAGRYVANGHQARPVWGGLGSLAESDLVDIVVRPAREVGVARA